MLRTIFVGLGGCGRHWLKNVYPHVPGTEVVAYVDASTDMLQRIQQELEITPETCFTSLETALAEVECDAVHIATNLPNHVPTALIALRANKHVLLEKPFAPTVAEAQEVVTMAEQRQRLLMINQNYRYSPAVYTVKKILQEGSLGAVGAIDIDFRFNANVEPADSPTNKHYHIWQPLLVDMSIHHFDLLRFILEQEPQQVFCHAWNTPWSNFEDPGAAHVMIKFPPNTTVSYRASWTTTDRNTSWTGEWRMECTKGSIVWGGRDDKEADRVTINPIWQDAIQVPLEHVPYTDWSGTLSTFVQSIADGTEPGNVGRQNLKTLAMTLAIVKSAETNQIVNL